LRGEVSAFTIILKFLKRRKKILFGYITYRVATIEAVLDISLGKL
jgi:hypothetical protein